MFIKGECEHCGGHIEFHVEVTGETMPCPPCTAQTILRPPASQPVPPRIEESLAQSTSAPLTTADIQSENTTADPCRYWAFISYNKHDAKWARWLHRAIESYGIPAQLVSHPTPTGHPAPKRFHPIFRDRDELPASSDLGAQIEEALRASHYLIVVCSPNAARSRWVDKEIEYFARLGRRDRVLALIVGGEPNTGDENECFPPQLLQLEPTAADARPDGDGKTNAKLKLLAGMLGVTFDTLKQRDAHRRVRRLQVILTAAILTTLAFAALSCFAFPAQRTAQRQMRRARSIALAVQADANRSEYPQRSLLLAVESVQTSLTHREDVSPSAEQALRNSLASIGGRPLVGHSGPIKCVGVSPKGNSLVMASDLGSVGIWDISGEKLSTKPRILPDIPTNVEQLAFSPDGNLLAVAGLEGNISIWDMRGKPSMLAVLQEPGEHLCLPTFSPDGSLLATGTAGDTNGVVRLWSRDTTNRKWTPTTILRDQDLVKGLVFSPNSERLAAFGGSYTIVIWELKTSAPPREYVPPHSGRDLTNFSGVKPVAPFSDMAFSPDGRWLVFANHMQTAVFVDLSKPDLKASEQITRGDVVAFSPDGHWCAIGDDNETVTLFKTKDSLGTVKLHSPGNHRELFVSSGKIKFSPDSRWLARLSDKVALVWDVETVKAEMAVNEEKYKLGMKGSSITSLYEGLDSQRPTVLRGHDQRIRDFAFDPLSKWLVTASADRTARIWNLADQFAESAIPIVIGKAEKSVVSHIVTPDNQLITLCKDGGLQVWDLPRPIPGSTAVTLSRYITNMARLGTMQVSPNGRWLVAEVGENTASLWDLKAPYNRTPIVLRGKLPWWRKESSFSVDNSWLAIVDGTEILLKDLRQQPELQSLRKLSLTENSDELTHVAFSADSAWLSAWNGRTQHLWNLKDPKGDTSAILLRGLASNIVESVFSPDSHWLMTRSADKALLWDISRSLNEALPFVLSTNLGASDEFSRSQFSSSGNWLVLIERQCGVCLWRLDGSKQPVKAAERDLIEVPQWYSPYTVAENWLAVSSTTGFSFMDLTSEIPVFRDVPNAISEEKPIVIQFSPDMKWMAAGYLSGRIQLWQITDRHLTKSPILLVGHDGLVASLDFSPQGGRMVSTGGDYAVLMWNLNAADIQGSVIRLPMVGDRFVRTPIEFAARSRWLLTEHGDSNIHLSPMEIPELLECAKRASGRNFSKSEWDKYFPDETFRETFVGLPSIETDLRSWSWK